MRLPSSDPTTGERSANGTLRPGRRGPAFVGLMLVTLLSVEGLLSLTTGRSLLRRAPRVFDADFGFGRVASAPPRAAELEQAARGNPGPYWLHPDPRVGLTLRPNSEMGLARATVRSGPLGLRRTPDPSGVGAGEPVRIAVVGASIPFGLGVADAETLAARLQELFAHVPVRGTTVAMPLWSYRNAVHFLLDHWDQLEPDIVLYMPFFNDLADTPIVDAAGHRAAWPDAASPHPWPPVDRRKDLIWKRLVWAVGNGRLPLTERELGSIAIEADLSPASSRRYDANAAALARLAGHCRERGAELAILAYREHTHGWHLLARLRALSADSEDEVPVVPFFRALHRDFKLGWDPHPNAETHRVMALWTARSLVELGWLPPPPEATGSGADAAWADAPRRYRAFRAEPWTAEEIRRRSEEARREALARTTAEIDFESGRGMKQVMAGLTWEGSATTGLLALLRRGRGLELTLEPLGPELHGGPGLYPLEIGVEIDGLPAGRIVLEGPDREGDARQRFLLEVEPGAGSGPVMEIRLLPRDWGVAEERQVLETVSFRPVRLRAVGDPDTPPSHEPSEERVDEGRHQRHGLQEHEEGGQG